MFDPKAALKALDDLRRADPECKLFGADLHQHKLNDALSSDDIEQFETTHGIRLPEDFRRFLIEMGDGGVGPFYGVFKLGEVDDGSNLTKWTEGDGMVGILKEPFAHREPWNDLEGHPDENPDAEDVDYDDAMEDFDVHYYDVGLVNGAIPICHHGCATRSYLVVSGPEAGNVWCDDRANYAGIFPVSIGGKSRASFGEWYLAWLERSLAEVGG